MTAIFSIREHDSQMGCTIDRVDTMVRFSRGLRKHTGALFERLGLREICKVNLDSVDYLLYADGEAPLTELAAQLKSIHSSISAEQNDCDVYLSFSSVLKDSMDILSGLDEAYFTGSLLMKNIFSGTVCSFSETGSYQTCFRLLKNCSFIEIPCSTAWNALKP